MNYRENVKLPISDIMEWNDLLDAKNVNYGKFGFAELSTVFRKTVTFNNGTVGELRINTETAEEGSFYAYVVLFDHHGREIGRSGPDWELTGGDWCVKCGDDTYSIQVVGV